MANAAAKKAAAAKQKAAATFFPIVVSINILYAVFFVVYKWASLTTFQGVMAVTLVGLSYVSYSGVVGNHGNHDFKNSKASDALAGGAFLDMLGPVTIVQFGSVLSTNNFYWLLLLIPIVGGFKLYRTVKGGLPGMPNANNAASSDGSEQISQEVKEKRQKRAERRRRKW